MVVILSEKSLVVQSNRLIEAKYRLSVEEQKIVKVLVAQIQKDDSDFKNYEFRIKELADMLGMKYDNPYVVIRGITRRLMTRVLEFENPETDTVLQTTWLSSALYKKGEGTVSLHFDPLLKPLLLHLQSCFTKYELGQIMQFKGQYSIRFFELRKSFLGQRKKEVFFSIKDLWAMLGLKKNEYKIFKNFKNRVLEPARLELIEKTGNSFTWETIKQGRGGKIVGVRFVFDGEVKSATTQEFPKVLKQEEPKQIVLVTESVELPKQEVEAVAELVSAGVSAKTAEALAVEHGAEKVREKIELAEQKRDVKNKAGFIFSALIGDWKDGKAEQQKREQAQQEERRNKSRRLAERTKIIQEWKDEYRAFTRSIVDGIFNSLGENEKELLRSQFLAEQPAMKQFLGSVFGVDKGAFHAFVAKKFASQMPTVDEFLRDNGFDATLEDMNLWEKL